MDTFTPSQRRVLLVLICGVIAVIALFVGFIVTSIRGLEDATPAPIVTLVLPTSTPLPPTPSPAPTVTPVTGIQFQIQAARLFDQVARQVESLRGLTPRAVVPLSFLKEYEMAALIRSLYTESDPQARLLPYVALDILPDGKVFTCTGNMTSLYVPEQEQLYISAIRPDNPDDQALLAHVYVHALQDQHFDLGAAAIRATTTDAALAVEALTEGDATLLMAFYRYQDPATADWDHLVALLVGAEQPGCGEELDANGAWMRLQRWPYQEGRQFVEAIFQAGGWQAVNRAYADLPRSTEQVLHPERYLGRRDNPESVFVPDLSPVLGNGWTLRLRDTLGEFVTGLYLVGTLPETNAWSAAAGWDGDTLVVWEHQGIGRVLVWRSAWESTIEASEFERALATLVPQRYLPAWPVEPPASLTGRWWETGTGVLAVSRVGRTVVLVRAPDVDTLARVALVLP